MKIFAHVDTEKDIPFPWKVQRNTDDGYEFINGTSWIGAFSLKGFPGDCGTLTLHGANNVTQEALKVAKIVADKSGYDTIIATLVELKENGCKQAIEAFKKERWIKAVDGKSNRKHNYKHNRKIVYILHLRKQSHKGY